jgi:multiple antibiotic resistance protein
LLNLCLASTTWVNGMTVTFGAVFVTMLVIMDPIGNVPIFLSVTRRLTPKQRSRSALLAVVTAAFVIAGFAVGGRQVLGFLDVSVPALQGAGGLLLLLVALQLLMSAEDDNSESAAIDHVAVAMVPLGTPLLAGPGAIVAAIVFVQNSSTARERWLIAGALAVVLVLVYLAMLFAELVNRLIGQSGIMLLSRIAGLLLAAIAVQMIADSVAGFVNAAV